MASLVHMAKITFMRPITLLVPWFSMHPRSSTWHPTCVTSPELPGVRHQDDGGRDVYHACRLITGRGPRKQTASRSTHSPLCGLLPDRPVVGLALFARSSSLPPPPPPSASLSRPLVTPRDPGDCPLGSPCPSTPDSAADAPSLRGLFCRTSAPSRVSGSGVILMPLTALALAPNVLALTLGSSAALPRTSWSPALAVAARLVPGRPACASSASSESYDAASVLAVGRSPVPRRVRDGLPAPRTPPRRLLAGDGGPQRRSPSSAWPVIAAASHPGSKELASV